MGVPCPREYQNATPDATLFIIQDLTPNSREDNRKKAEDKLNELNLRFADWYYVISDDVYKKIHLGRVDVVKQKEKTDEEQKEAVDAGFDMESFRQLQEQGLTTGADEEN